MLKLKTSMNDGSRQFGGEKEMSKKSNLHPANSLKPKAHVDDEAIC